MGKKVVVLQQLKLMQSMQTFSVFYN